MIRPALLLQKMQSQRGFLLFFFSFFLIFLSLVSAPKTHAQTYTNTHTQNDRERVFVIMEGIFSFTSCQLSGVDVMKQNAICLEQNTTAKGNQKVGGMLGFLTTSLRTLYISPINSSQYTQYLANNFGISKSAYAQNQTEGFTSLSPVLKMWEKIRDLTFTLIVIFFIIIGFGIMIRFKIDPRTVMTIQNQIPKIIISLILITFSYAIAGLMIDTMWFTTYTGINILGDTIDDPAGAGDATRNILNNPINYASSVLNTGNDTLGPLDGIKDVSGKVGDYVSNNASDVVTSIIFGDNNSSGDCASILGGIDIGNCVRGALSKIVEILVDPVITIIIFIAILIALFRVWFTLLKCYVYVLLYTILAPFWILLGLLPNSSFGFTNWLRAFSARLFVFPATALLFMAARVFLSDSTQFGSAASATGGSISTFVPPLVGNPNIVSTGLGPLIAFGIIMLAPELLTILMNALKTKPFEQSKAVGGGFVTGAALGGALAGGITGRFMKRKDDGSAVGTGAVIADRTKYSAGKWIGSHKITSPVARARDFLRKEPPKTTGGTGTP